MLPNDFELPGFRQANPKSASWPCQHPAVKSIGWNLEVLDLLRKEAFKDADKEVGGLLFGTIEKHLDGDLSCNVFVRWFFPVSCSYVSGPFYRLTQAERGRFQESIPDSVKYGRWSLVGFYRSQRRPDLSLDDADREVAVHVLSDPAHIVVIIKPITADIAVVSLFVRGDGTMSGKPEISFSTDFKGVEITSAPLFTPDFESRDAAKDLAPDPFEAVNSTRYLRVMAALENQKTAPTTKASSVEWRRPFRFAAVALIAGVLGFVVARSTVATHQGLGPLAEGNRTSSQIAGEFGLKAFAEFDHLRVKWDPGASDFQAGATGSLVVKDGRFRNVIPLDSASLKRGSVTYFPLTASVALELRVGGKSDFCEATGISEETVRSVSRVTGKTSLSSTSTAVPKLIRESVVNTRQPFDSPRITKTLAPSAAKPGESKTEQQTLAPAPMGMPEFVPAGPGQAALPDPLQNTVVAPPPSTALDEKSAQVALAVASGYVPSSPQPAVRTSAFVPPYPLVRFEPNSREFGWRVNHDTQVSVRVKIDRAGRVIKAHAFSALGTPLVAALVGPSIRAASKWQFAPGTQNGEGVESDYVITFRFRPH